jgi:hypothetical protein
MEGLKELLNQTNRSPAKDGENSRILSKFVDRIDELLHATQKQSTIC